VLPHFSNECLAMMGDKENLNWPTYDEKFIEESIVPIVIQINGKKRGIIYAKKDLEENELFDEIKKNEKISKYTDETKIQKRIYVKNKIMNLII
jgi:leucyl-tRNA synthetase